VDALADGVVLCQWSVNPFQDFIFQFAAKRPPRPYFAIARLATPPFFFFEKVGGEMLVIFLFLVLFPALFLFLPILSYIRLKL
jgi:hypothetical protein